MFIALVTFAFGVDVKKGVLLVRRGDPTQDANYDKDDRDPNGKLMGVSVQCNPGVAYTTEQPQNQVRITALIGNQAGFANRGFANSTCIINHGGNVKTDPVDGNENHCVINSVKLGDLKGCWQ
jgi:hypothetical protein